jgi:hypothetical protein
MNSRCCAVFPFHLAYVALFEQPMASFGVGVASPLKHAGKIVFKSQPDACPRRSSWVSYSVPRSILVANRCLAEPASRALDAAIYCAVLGTADANTLTSAPLIEARARGMILVNQAAIKGWVDAPAYTEDLSCARSLVPEGLSTIACDPRIVCATALTVRALLDLPPLPLIGWRKHWLA